MIKVIGQVVAQEQTGTRVEVAGAGCLGCKAHCERTREILLPGFVGSGNGLLELSLTNVAFSRILLHSLGLPLIGFIAGASIVHFFFSGSDFFTFAGALAGLLTGLLLCRRQTLDQVEIREAVNNG